VTVSARAGCASVEGPDQRGIDVSALVELAADGLVKMFDGQKHLFCFTRKRTPERVEPVGLSHRYTMMSLLGLYRLSTEGRPSGVEFRDACHSLLDDLGWVDNAGDLGLLMWLCAVVTPERVETLWREKPISRSLDDYADGRCGSTTELAWVLTGLAYAMKVSSCEAKARTLANAVFERLVANQGPFGFFGHMATNHSVAGAIRGRIGSFADQVYSIYAMSQFGRVTNSAEALSRVRRCADAICGAQGPLGQWWWHYHAQTGRVVQRFPVYSVHQHGMAPMALFAAEEFTGVSYRGAIRLGLEWITRNELAQDLRDTTAQLVWRSIEDRSRWQMYARESVTYVLGDRYLRPRTLVINHECRPYELGWLAYAFAGRLNSLEH
jgi:hypothetical protein